tara:strand:- start:3495 stop:3941 length:447 start_codon:yes stop_codon:yes gene_type:complete
MKWIKATSSIASEVGENLRRQDVNEVLMSHGMTGHQAVMESFKQSSICQAIEGDDGDPVGLTGVVDNRIWLLGTDKLTATKNHRWQLCLYGREWVEHCLESVGKPIGNYVYSENKKSIRWLKHLGFIIYEPEPFGPWDSMFCPFWRSN